MDRQDPLSNIDEDIINSATSVEEVIRTLAKRGCADLTSSIDLASCSENPCAGGGFCDVYRGRLHDGTQIAIKSLRVYDGPEADSQRGKILKHAARELYHWSKLQHPNVLRLMGLTLFRDRIAMVSEWMDNGSLMSYLRLKPSADRLALCTDICAGLCYIHAHGMIHGDLKAANIMISSRGIALIADFGNAQLRDFTLKFSNTGRFSTSLRWTAPELLDGDESLPPTREADVYSCGMVMLEVLTGEIPFQAKKDTEVFCLVLRQQRPPRPAIELDDRVWELVNSCWAWSPSERPSIETVKYGLRMLNPGYDHRTFELGHEPKQSLELGVWASELLGLGNACVQKFETHGQPADIDQAIEYHSLAVRLTPDKDPHRPARMSWLGISHHLRFKHHGELEDIDQAIIYHRQAVQLSPDDDTKKSYRFFLLGMSYYLRFKHHGELADANQAITYLNQAVELTPDNDADKPAQLYWLARSHYLRPSSHDKRTDIDKAIVYLHQAVQLSADPDSDKSFRLYLLGASYYHRFQQDGKLADVDQAINYYDQSVQLTSHEDTNQRDRSFWLGASHYLRFHSHSEPADLDQAIHYQNQAVQLTPDGHKDKPVWCYWLGISHYFRFEHLGELSDIEQAVSYHKQAVQRTPNDDVDRPDRLYWLKKSRSRRSKFFDKHPDVDQKTPSKATARKLVTGGSTGGNLGSTNQASLTAGKGNAET